MWTDARWPKLQGRLFCSRSSRIRCWNDFAGPDGHWIWDIPRICGIDRPIILAGPAGSAFAAEIGTMKTTEELDACRMFALDPMIVLIVPRDRFRVGDAVAYSLLDREGMVFGQTLLAGVRAKVMVRDQRV